MIEIFDIVPISALSITLLLLLLDIVIIPLSKDFDGCYQQTVDFLQILT